MVTTRPPKTIVKPTALGPVANTDTKLLIYGLFQKGRVWDRTPYRPRILASLGEPRLGTSNPKRPGTWILSPFVFLDTTGFLTRLPEHIRTSTP